VSAEQDSKPASNEPVGRAKKPLSARVSGFIGTPLFWVIALGLLFVLPITRTMALEPPKPPELHIPLPAFTMTNEHGEAYGLDNLKGRIWVADFIFTSCATACPKLTKRMAEIQHRGRNLGDAFHLVSFTVDPENDTPERLLAYARSYHANANRWSFLTGPNADVEKTVVKGFKMAMGKEESEPGSGIFSIFHGEKLVLVDQTGDIRGYYDAEDADIDRLMRDIGVLVNID
jgi:protein SCO1/2